MDSKKIKTLRIFFYIFIGLSPASFVTAVILTIIYQTNVDYNNISTELAVMSFLSYVFIVLMIVFLLLGFGVSRRIRKITHKEILDKALSEHKEKQPEDE